MQALLYRSILLTNKRGNSFKKQKELSLSVLKPNNEIYNMKIIFDPQKQEVSLEISVFTGVANREAITVKQSSLALKAFTISKYHLNR